MSEEYDHDRQKAVTDETNRTMEAERLHLRKAITGRRGRMQAAERPREVGTVLDPIVLVPTVAPSQDGGEPE